MKMRPATVGYLILTACVVGAFYAGYHNDQRLDENRRERVAQINRINREQCAALQNLYLVIRRTVQDADRQIDTLNYYRMNPQEAEAAHRRNERTLELFKVPPCPPEATLRSE